MRGFKKLFLTITALTFLAGVVWAWGPGGGAWGPGGGGAWGPGSGWGYRGWGYYGAFPWNNGSYQSVYNQISGVITKIQTMAGPGRRGFPWIVLEVKTDQGKSVLAGLGPQWWGAPPELKQGVRVSLTTFYPPGWSYRGIPYSLACSITFPGTGKSYSLRPCGWWGVRP